MASNELLTAAQQTQARRIQRGALIAGGAGVGLAVLGALLDLDQFFRSYLWAYVFWLGISLGCLAWLLVQYIAGGRWGVVIRPVLEAGALGVGVMALLFLPLLFGLGSLYEWSHPEAVAHDALLAHKAPWLNVPFFIGRALLYLAVWGLLIGLLARWRTRLEANWTPALADRLRRFSGPGLALYGLAVTFAAFDWMMSLEPHWYSTIYGLLVAAGQAVAGLAWTILVFGRLAPSLPETHTTERIWMDLGNLLFAVVLFWAYIAFMQFFIIWSANIPEEVVWYLRRLEGGWEWVAIAIVLLHFALPFALLLSGNLKRSPRRLMQVAALLLVMQLVHTFWMVAPVFAEGRLRVHWLDVVLPVAVGGVWLAAFVWLLARRAAVRHVEVPQEAAAHA